MSAFAIIGGNQALGVAILVNTEERNVADAADLLIHRALPAPSRFEMRAITRRRRASGIGIGKRRERAKCAPRRFRATLSKWLSH